MLKQKNFSSRMIMASIGFTMCAYKKEIMDIICSKLNLKERKKRKKS